MAWVPAVSLREKERGQQIGAGWNPHWHQPTDLYDNYSDKDFLLGLNAAQTTLAGPKVKRCVGPTACLGCQLTTCACISMLEAVMGRSTHPKKEVEEALKHAESNGWRVSVGGAHAWGKIYCPFNSADCRCGEFCIASIWSTPKSPGNHARALKRVVDHCCMRVKTDKE